MKEFEIVLTHTATTTMVVKADSREDAIEMAKKQTRLDQVVMALETELVSCRTYNSMLEKKFVCEQFEITRIEYLEREFPMLANELDDATMQDIVDTLNEEMNNTCTEEELQCLKFYREEPLDPKYEYLADEKHYLSAIAIGATISDKEFELRESIALSKGMRILDDITDDEEYIKVCNSIGL